MKIGSLFSGAGGLDMAVEKVFGGHTIWHVENDPTASKVLRHHWPTVPNYGDITKVDWKQVHPADVLCGGYPCQPFSSSAGNPQGGKHELDLWPYFIEAIRHLRPHVVVLENVAGHRSLGFNRVLADLARVRYDAQWCSLRASDVGAPHQRERLFAVATDTTNQFGSPIPPSNGSYRSVGCTGFRAGYRDSAWDLAAGVQVLGRSPRPESTWGDYGPAIRHWERLTRPHPVALEPNKDGGALCVAASFSEWLMGWPKGWVTDVPGISRNQQLRIIGNGVVPQQAAAALRYLLTLTPATVGA